MSYIYKCETCNAAVELDSKQRLTCRRCDVLMDCIATAQSMLKCDACNTTLMGPTEVPSRSWPCPFCDGGVMRYIPAA